MSQTTNAQRSTPKGFASRELNAEVSATGATSNVKHETSNIIWRIVDFIIAGVFVYAGTLKALDPVQFASDIDNYKILPWPVCVALAFYLPWLEILCGLGLVFRIVYRGALSILTALIVVFILATIAAKVRGLDISCGCFGHASKNWSFTAHVALDLILLAAAISLLGIRRRELAGTS
jgi:putative oxidoreductase